METKAMARFARIAPRKARAVVRMVQGKKVSQALDWLAFTPKSAAPIVRKLIESALANAKRTNANLNVDSLVILQAVVDKGPNKHLHRWRSRAMGRATQITKGMSHIQVVLSDAPQPTKSKAKTQPTPTQEPKQEPTPSA